jgi:GntR family transcriptional regulator
MTDWQLDSENNIPFHLQLENQIKARIESGHWKSGDRIPSERDFMQLVGISRATIRQALNSLVHQQVLEKNHGRGTFVRQPHFEQPLQIVYSFAEQLRQAGVSLEDTLIERRTMPADAELARRLDMPEGDLVIYLKRVRKIKDIPVMVNITSIPLATCPDLMDETFGKISLYTLLTRKYGITVNRAIDRLEAISADKEMAALLKVPRRTPLMFVERTALTRGEAVLHIGYNYIRGDMCSFRSDMQTQPAIQLKTTTPD